MDRSLPLPLHPELKDRLSDGPPPPLSALIDPDRGPSLCYALADQLRAANKTSPVSGAVLFAFARWLDALILVTEALLDAGQKRHLADSLADDLGPEEYARLRDLVAASVPGFLPSLRALGSAPSTFAEADSEAVPSGSDGAELFPLTALLLTMLNPAAAAPAAWLGLDRLAANPDAGRVFTSLKRVLSSVSAPDGGGSLFELLELPVRHSPDRLDEQLLIVADAWRPWLGDAADHCARAAGVLREESRPRFDGPGDIPVFQPSAETVSTEATTSDKPHPEPDIERFSDDRDWMPRLILLAKNTHVWLHQLTQRHGRDITRLDQVPDEELDLMAARGITGLWLIGLWQRSAASREIKRRSGNPEALSSAYAVDDYRIADDLGGDAALDELRERALARGIRMCGDMVPNHTGVDGRWVLERPELFLSLDHSPYPGYTFDGPDLSPDSNVSIRLEDHYWERSDAAVVFERENRDTGEIRYLYHGNDGTSMPWNDTAQLDFLNPETREAVIETIIAVARRFPVIRFDAAMVLARRHLRRLWHPAPGHDSDIPTRASRALSPEDFDRAMPAEFWREVVDRVAVEAPDTLLLAEAFWLMEGYFVRNLGMHRVYNSAFMHMLRDQDNAKFRQGLKNVLAHDPRVLQRFVNFMSNPDEETAVEQFGTGDKYFGVATLLATLPGLPLIGHGQLEGYAEKYGMEYARAYLDEQPDTGFMEHHDRMISPLFHRRQIFAGADSFRLFDVRDDNGHVVEDMIAYANRRGDEAGLVIVNNCHQTRRGRLHRGWSPDGTPSDSLSDVLGLDTAAGGLIRLRDPRTEHELTLDAHDLHDAGFEIELPPYGAAVFLEWYTEARNA